jgi:hypothetical protein
MDRLYERLTPVERFKIAVAAFGRGDLTEVDRLNDSTPYRTIKVQEPAYFDRLQRITWLALYFSVRARDLQGASLSLFAALVLLTLRAEDRDNGTADEDDAKFEELCDRCAERIARLKALSAAWADFCSGLGLSASDVDKMIGMPVMGSLGQLEIIQEIAGEVPPDEEYQRECLDHMRGFWKIKLEDRYAALG